jgi:hypothetical protein
VSPRGFVVTVIVVAALVLAWQRRERLLTWAESAPLQAVPSSSQGGSITEAPPATDASPPKVRSKFRPGALRKCVNGQQVAYTNVECPPGTREQALGAAPVNVVPAPPATKPADTVSAPSSLREALGVSGDDKLRSRLIERAVDGHR